LMLLVTVLVFVNVPPMQVSYYCVYMWYSMKGNRVFVNCK